MDLKLGDFHIDLFYTFRQSLDTHTYCQSKNIGHNFETTYTIFF